MKKVMFIYPPYYHTPGRFEKPANITEPPLGIAYLAAYLRQHYPEPLEVRILDAAVMNLKVDEIIEKAMDFAPDLIGISAVTVTTPVTKKIFCRLREVLPSVINVVGGPHPTALPFDILPEADICVIGEGEKTMLDILCWHDGKLTLADIKGISYRWNGEDRFNGRQDMIADLDSLPFPARDLLPMERYRHQHAHKTKNTGYTLMITVRGCPYRCTFCALTNMWGNRLRQRSAANVVAEIEEVIKRYNVSFIFFQDDTFTSDRQRTYQICKLIKEKQLPFQWACMIRADTLDKEMLALMKEAGCVEVHVGVESGNEEILKKINKGVTKDELRNAFQLLKQANMVTKGFFIIGNPGETKKTIKDTIDFAVELDPTFAFFSTFIPFPGLALFEEYKKKGYIKDFNWSSWNYYSEPVFETEELTKRNLVYFRRRAHLRFYLRPHKIMVYLWQTIRTGRIGTQWRLFLAFINIIFSGKAKQPS